MNEGGDEPKSLRSQLDKMFGLNCSYHPVKGELSMSSTLSKSKKKKQKALENNVHLREFYPKTTRQLEFWELMERNVITIAIGAAGVGKTLVALHFGIKALFNNDIERIVYLRSDVGLDYQRKRGALPGNLGDKIAPLILPIRDNIPFIVNNPAACDLLLSSKKIEPVFLEDVRGRSFAKSFVIVDEAQNFTKDHIKTVLSRICTGSKIVLIGDTTQADLEVFRRENGLLDAYRRIKHLKDVGTIQFEREDIVRNGILQEILECYES